MRKFLILALVAIVITPLWAARSADHARAAAKRWGAHRHGFGGRGGAAVERVTRHRPTDGDDFFAVKFAGGGTAFVAGDGEDELPIAFTTSTNDFSSIDKASPLWALLARDAKVRWLAGVKRQALTSSAGSPISSDADISDMRVPPLVQSKWNQEDGIYNYYTPNNYLCGCVATAMSQVMRYYQYPTASRAQVKRKCYSGTKAVSLTTAGGIYNWANMPYKPTSPVSDTVKQAIGKLTSDAGISVYMQYDSGGSGAFDQNVPDALISVFGYGSAIFHKIADLDIVIKKGMFANFDAGYPVILGICNATGNSGHCIVGDGYGYEGGLPYVHLNMGWSGASDLWYNLPSIGTTYKFSVVDDIVANIFPTNAVGSVVVSGRVTDGMNHIGSVEVCLCSDASGEVLAKTVANEYGVWGFVTTGGVYRVKVQNVSEGGECQVSVGAQKFSSYTFRGGVPDKEYGESYTCSKYATSFANSYGNEIVLTGASQVKMPTADVKAGTIFGSTNVALSCATDGAVIRYTLDGTTPDESASVYTSPITIDHACTLKARAFKKDMTESPILTINYSWHRGAATVSIRTDGTGDYPTILDAVADAVNGDIFLVGPGVYHGGVKVPANVTVRMISTDGPSATIIDGDGESSCFYGGDSPDSVISGFTLENGRDDYGGGIHGGIATNCIFTDCYADYGGGAYDAILQNCYLYENFASESGGGALYAELFHCTVYGNYTGGTGGGVDCGCCCYDSIVWGNYVENGDLSNWESFTDAGDTYRTWMIRCCTTPSGFSDGGGNLTDSPKFCDAANRDFRLREGSPCIGAGENESNIGAYQGAGIPGHTITLVIVGNGYVACGGHVNPASVYVGYGASVGFTALEDHPLIRFETNRVDVGSSSKFVWEDVVEDGMLTAYFASTNFYVDAALGNDDNRGWDWTEPKATIIAATDVAGDGETVFVKPGTYVGCVAPRQKAAVSVVSTDGPEVTTVTIDENYYNCCFYALDSSESVISGFTLTNGWDYCGGGIWGGIASNCVIIGCGSYYGGGAACARLYDCYVVDCSAADYVVDEDCYPACGGGVAESDCVRCTLTGNYACGNRVDEMDGCSPLGGGAYRSTLTDCIVYDNGLYYYSTGHGSRNEWVTSETCESTLNSSCTDDPHFVNSATMDLRLKVGSPCIAAAGDGVHNQGAYQGVGVRSAEMTDADVAEAIANTLTQAGFVEDTTAAVTNEETYAAIVEWTKKNNVPLTALAESSAPVTSVALGADAPVEMTDEDVKITEVKPEDGEIKLKLSLEAYDAMRANESILKAAVGIVGSAIVSGDYSADNLQLDVRKGEAAVELSVKPPESNAYFMRVKLR